MNRRTFLSGLLASTAAIPLAKAAPLAETFSVTTKWAVDTPLYQQLTDITRQAFVPRLWVNVYHAIPEWRE